MGIVMNKQVLRDRKGAAWWKSTEEHYYKVYVSGYGKIRGTWRFLIAYISTRNILWYPLWRAQRFFCTAYNILLVKEKTIEEKIQDRKNDRENSRGLASFLLDRNKKRQQKMKRLFPVKANDLPKIGGEDPEEYDETCILSLKQRVSNESK